MQFHEVTSLPLSIGAKGELVKKLQARLGIKADRLFGPATKQVVMNFQKAHGLKVDGIVGSQTWAALFPPMHRVIVDGKEVIDSAYKDKVLAAVSAALDKYQDKVEIIKR